MSDIPLQDTPTAALIARGYGGPTVDRERVQLCMDFLRTAKKALHYFYTRFQQQDLSPGKYSVLLELFVEDQALSPSELAARLGVSGPTITGLTDRLARQGYVRRTLGRDDRRRVSIQLTPAGKGFTESLLPGQLESMALTMARISNEEFELLRSLLSRVEQTFDQEIHTEVGNAATRAN